MKFISTVKHARYVMGSLTAVLFAEIGGSGDRVTGRHSGVPAAALPRSCSRLRRAPVARRNARRVLGPRPAPRLRRAVWDPIQCGDQLGRLQVIQLPVRIRERSRTIPDPSEPEDRRPDRQPHARDQQGHLQALRDVRDQLQRTEHRRVKEIHQRMELIDAVLDGRAGWKRRDAVGRGS